LCAWNTLAMQNGRYIAFDHWESTPVMWSWRINGMYWDLRFSHIFSNSIHQFLPYPAICSTSLQSPYADPLAARSWCMPPRRGLGLVLWKHWLAKWAKTAEDAATNRQLCITSYTALVLAGDVRLSVLLEDAAGTRGSMSMRVTHMEVRCFCRRPCTECMPVWLYRSTCLFFFFFVVEQVSCYLE
jgi:hypothetical protein